MRSVCGRLYTNVIHVRNLIKGRKESSLYYNCHHRFAIEVVPIYNVGSQISDTNKIFKIQTQKMRNNKQATS